MVQISAPQPMGAHNKRVYVSAMEDGCPTKVGCQGDLVVVNNGLPCHLPLRCASAPVSGERVKTLDSNLLILQVGKAQWSDLGHGWVRHLLE